MRISIRHQLSVTPPPGTTNAVLQLLLTPQSGPTQKVESWSVEMAGIGNAGPRRQCLRKSRAGSFVGPVQCPGF